MPMNVITRLSNMGHAGAARQVINMKRNHVLCVRVGDGIRSATNTTTNKSKFHDGCRYRTYLEDYEIEIQNTDNEQIEISPLRREEYQAWYRITNKNDSDFWMHTSNFEDFEKIRKRFRTCLVL